MTSHQNASRRVPIVVEEGSLDDARSGTENKEKTDIKVAIDREMEKCKCFPKCTIQKIKGSEGYTFGSVHVKIRTPLLRNDGSVMIGESGKSLEEFVGTQDPCGRKTTSTDVDIAKLSADISNCFGSSGGK